MPLQPNTFYDDVWTQYGHLDGKSPAAFHRRRLVRKLAHRYARDAAHVLDAGCGPGQLLLELGVRLPHATLAGADVSPHSLALARERAPTAELFQLDLEAPGFEAVHAARLGRFELVVCSEVLEHLAGDALAVERLRLLMAPGGILIVSVPGGKMSRFDEAIGHRRHYREAALRALLERAGLELVSSMAWGFPFQNAYRTAVRLASRAALGHPRAQERSVGKSLGVAYTALGSVLRPLFFLNLPRFGEQLFAVARRAR